MYDFIQQYLPYIVMWIGYLGPVLPFLRQRIVQDKNIASLFTNLKDLASKLGLNEEGLLKAILKIDNVATNLESKVDNLAANIESRVDKKIAELDEKITQLNKAVVDFMQSELYQRMLTGLEGLNQLAQIIQNKDQTIQDVGVILKDFKAEIIKLQQKV